MTCWSCKADVAGGALFCGACRRIQPMGQDEDHFSILGLPRRYAIDWTELERSYRDRSRLLHPDRFARADERERQLSLERATRLNDAHRCLRDWRLRADYLLELAGVDTTSDEGFAGPELLEELLELREGLALAAAEGNVEKIGQIARDARERLRRIEGDVGVRFERPERDPEQLAEIARSLSRARFFDALVSEAERAAAERRT